MIEIDGLTKRYGEKKIFDNFCLTIKKGEFIVLSGESGKGKTTLMNIIGGLEPFDSGKVIVNGTDLSKKRKSSENIAFFRNTIGFLFQNFGLIENKTVKQNLDIVKKSAMSDISPKDALEKVGLKGYEDKKVYTLSGGEQQRVAIARLMIKKCSIVLADEPTGSLDKHNAEIVMNFLLNLSKEAEKTIIMATHDEVLKMKGDHLIEL